MNKWIIVDNQLRLSACIDFHKQLLSERHLEEWERCGGDKSRLSFTIGGGWWHRDEKNSKFYFYADSHDFGQVTREQFGQAERPFSLDSYALVFSTAKDLSEVLISNDNLILNPITQP